MPAHLFDASTTDWTTHERFTDLRIKIYETRQTHPWASVTEVELGVGGLIPTHLHEVETETIYVLGGQGLLAHGDVETTVRAGMGGSIPPGLLHSLRNTGEVPLQLIAIHMPPIR